MEQPSAGVVALVALGGALGSVGRYAVETAIPFAPTEAAPGFPWATATVNVTGALAIGFVVAWLTAHPAPPRWARPFVVVGLLGGWTTYSTFAAESFQLWQAGAPGPTIAYVVGSVVAGLVAVIAGAGLGQRLWPTTRGEIRAGEVSTGA